MSKHLYELSLGLISRVFVMSVLLIVLMVAMVPMAATIIAPPSEAQWKALGMTWSCDATCFSITIHDFESSVNELV